MLQLNNIPNGMTPQVGRHIKIAIALLTVSSSEFKVIKKVQEISKRKVFSYMKFFFGLLSLLS